MTGQTGLRVTGRSGGRGRQDRPAPVPMGMQRSTERFSQRSYIFGANSRATDPTEGEEPQRQEAQFVPLR